MREIRVSSTLTVYHDGQFWVGVFECRENGRLSACRMVFGAEPSCEEIGHIVCDGWNDLSFGESTVKEEVPRVIGNPKRRQREAARELRRKGTSTKAQQVLSEEREAKARQRDADARERRELERQRKFDLSQQKRKQRHRGR